MRKGKINIENNLENKGLSLKYSFLEDTRQLQGIESVPYSALAFRAVRQGILLTFEENRLIIQGINEDKYMQPTELFGFERAVVEVLHTVASTPTVVLNFFLSGATTPCPSFVFSQSGILDKPCGVSLIDESLGLVKQLIKKEKSPSAEVGALPEFFI